MANIEIKNPHEYCSEVRKFETTDRAHADILNKPLEQLLNNEEFLKELLELITKKAEEHIGSGAIHVTTEDKQNWNGKAGTNTATQQKNGLMSNTDKAKLDGVAANAEVNQNAISSIKVGTTVISSNAKTGQITIVAASNNVSITGDNATKQIEISVTGGNADTLGNHAPSYFSAAGHTHDDRYYTETEMNTKLNGKANSSHTHNYAGSDSAGGKANSAKSADSVTWGNVSGKPSSYPPSSHNHTPAEISGGQFSDFVKAKNDNNYAHVRLRNIYAGTSELTANSSSLTNGDIYICFE